MRKEAESKEKKSQIRKQKSESMVRGGGGELTGLHRTLQVARGRAWPVAGSFKKKSEVGAWF